MKRRNVKKYILLAVSLFWLSLNVIAIPPDSSFTTKDTTKVNQKRLAGVIAVEGTLYFASLAGLYFAWYNDFEQTSFHFFNDNGEWMQMDKIGHANSAYFLSRMGYESYKWAGVKESTSILLGGLAGFAYQANIEILDAYSAGWGFSAGDIIGNTAGCVLFMSQQFAWHEQRFLLKYSYHPTKYIQYRPGLLGDNLLQNAMKDYNGITFWLSGNIHSFLPEKSRFPKWINVAFGYGAEGMTGASVNNPTAPQFDRYRQFFFSLDVDLQRIPTKSKTLKTIFTIFNFVKIPFPAIEYNTLGQIKLYPLYF